MILTWDWKDLQSSAGHLMSNTLDAVGAVSPKDLPRRWLRLAALVAATGLIILAFAVLNNSSKATRDLQGSTAARAHTYEVLLDAQRLLSALENAETGQRGYLLTQKETYLEPYETGKSNVHENLSRLLSLSDANLVQLKRLDRIRTLCDEKLAELGRTIALAKAGQRDEALALVATDTGKRLMDQARAEILSFIDAEKEDLDQRAIAARRAVENQTYYLIAFAAVGAALIFAAAAGLLFGALSLTVHNAQEAIGLTQTRLESTFQNAAVGIANVSTDGHYLGVNRRLCEITGFTEQELLSKTVMELTHPEDKPSSTAKLKKILNDEASSCGIEKRMLRRDGSYVWVRSTLGPSRSKDGSLEYLIAVVEDISERKRAEETVSMLMREIDHRSKNLLTLVQVIARRTAATGTQSFLNRFEERLRALSASQDLLRDAALSASLAELVRSQLAHFNDLLNTRIFIKGPPLAVSAQAAQTLGMALHELATNAGKYGALSNDSGRVSIEWGVVQTPEGEERFHMKWQESGGPAVSEPSKQGFGKVVMTQLAERSLGGSAKLDFAPGGLTWELECPASSLNEAAA
jgi:PAS domain S-box-containing protein